MTQLLLKLLGAKIENAKHIASVGLQLRNLGALGWVIFFALAFGALTWWTYWRGASRELAPARKRVLIALRVVLFVLILFALLRPVVAFAIEGNIRRMLVMLIDNSSSMNIQDPRVTDADIKRAAIGKGVLPAAKGLAQSLDSARANELKHVARADLLKSVLRNQDLRLLPKFQQAFDLNVFGFGQNVTELTAPITGAATPTPAPDATPAATPTPGKETKPSAADEWVKNYAAKAPMTAIGDAVREIVERKRGQPLAGIFLVTDGANNAGGPPMDAASLAAQEGVPLYIYGIGITSPRDIIVGNLFAPEVAFAKDELAVTVRVRGQGLKGETAKLSLKLGDETVATQDVAFTGDEEQVVPVRFTPTHPGEFDLRAEIPPRDDETIKDNNAVSQRIRVIDSKIKVLYVEQTPRWEFKHLAPILLRDRRMDAKFFLLEGDPGIAKAEGSPYLARFPEKKDDLFKFDLLILGDVTSKALTQDQLDSIGEFVSKFGGACVLIAGKRFNPSSYRNTVIEKMLPVDLDPFTGEGTAKAGADKPVALEITPLGRTNQMFTLSPKEDENASLWKRFAPVYWANKVSRAKPAAQVFLVDPDPAKASRFGKMPVIAQQQYGLGQVLYVGTDNLWRWRKNSGDPYYEQLWGQITQRMALTHLLGGSKRTQLSVDKQKYTTGDRVTVYARLYTENFEPVKDPAVRGSFVVHTKPENQPPGASEKQDVVLRAVPEQLGMYRGDFVAVQPGTYAFSVASDPKTVLEFTATEPKFELGETAMNEGLLKEMARVSGGAFFREEDLHKLPDMLSKKTEAVRSEVDAEIWSSWFYFALILGVATAEWILRKRWHLK
jgi:hypothetical protein